MGGDSLGITNSGFNLIAYSEIEEKFQKTHNLNFKNCKLLGNGDIRKTPHEDFLKYKGEIDIIFAGFPCQGFSNAGKKDKTDPRNTLFREFLRAVSLVKPKYLIGENVKGLLTKKTSDGENYIDVISEEFEKLGYKISHKVMKCHLYGIPQKRERLIIVGCLEKEFKFPEEEPDTTNLKDIVKFDMTGALEILKEDFDMTTIPEECILKDLENEESEKIPHPNLKLLAKDKDYVYSGKTYPRRLSFGKRDSSIHGEIIDIRRPCKTIICTYARQPRLFVPLQNKNGYFLRCLLPEELKRIQGFPADFEIFGNTNDKIIQIGNAVPPPLVEKIIANFI
jgi:DNA (cytosine-5)-methyltransferase 1